MSPHKLWIVSIALATFIVGASEAWTQSNETVLHYFNGGGDASRPSGGVIQDAAGNLYGTSDMGGNTNDGVVYMLSPAMGGWTESVIHSFYGPTDGGGPSGLLAMDAGGNLYGSTYFAGAANQGTVYKLAPTGNGQWTFSVLYAFTGKADGGQPEPLILDAAGNLYGAAAVGGITHGVVCVYGCGVLFRLSPTNSGPWKETVLYAFQGGKDGRNGNGALVFDKLGNLYGTASQGGNFKGCGSEIGCGVVFELSPTKRGPWKETVLYAFAGGRDGEVPTGPLVFDGAGNLYGPTVVGGDINSCPGGCGVIFELSPSSSGGWSEQLLHTFRGPVDGQDPLGPLTFDAQGNLFGVAWIGGPSSGGTIYELSPQSNGSWTIKAIRAFLYGGFQGSFPNPGLLLDVNGNLYGSTNSGGPSGSDGGLVYEIKAAQ